MNAQNLGARVRCRMLRGDVLRHAFDGAAGVISAGSDGRGEQRSGAKSCDSGGYGGQCVVIALHEVAAAGSMDVHVNKAGDGGAIESLNFVSAAGQSQSGTRGYGFNFTVANNDSGVGNFSFRCDGFGDV